jgi:hypothetical protein
MATGPDTCLLPVARVRPLDGLGGQSRTCGGSGHSRRHLFDPVHGTTAHVPESELVAGRYGWSTVLGEGGRARLWTGRDELRAPGGGQAGAHPTWTADHDRDVLHRHDARSQVDRSHQRPRVITVYDVVLHDGSYIVMESVPSRSPRPGAGRPAAGATAGAQIGLHLLGALDLAHREASCTATSTREQTWPCLRRRRTGGAHRTSARHDRERPRPPSLDRLLVAPPTYSDLPNGCE